MLTGTIVYGQFGYAISKIGDLNGDRFGGMYGAWMLIRLVVFFLF